MESQSPAAQQQNGVLVRSRYRLVQHLSETLYGAVYLCEDTQQPEVASPRSVDMDATTAGQQVDATAAKSVSDVLVAPRRVVLKQVELAQAMHLLNTPHPQQQMLDDPRQEKAVANLLRRTGGHPHVVQYLDDFIEDSTLFFVMEFCADGDLYEYLRRRGKTTLSSVDAMSVLAQVGSGVAFLHDHGVAHRDISLENVMLNDGVCKIGDFGLSARATQPRCERVGKAYYMAPEVVAGETYDAKAADIWSLGILLFILLTGSPLVPIASMSDRAFAVLKQLGVVAVLKAWGVELSKPITELLEGLLAVKPSKRLTIAQVLQHRAFDEWEASFSDSDASEASTYAT
ncbi:Serine/threonine protein kinase [Globisporangium polare]